MTDAKETLTELLKALEADSNDETGLSDEALVALMYDKGVSIPTRTIIIDSHLNNNYTKFSMSLSLLEAQDPTDSVVIELKCFGGCIYDAAAIVGRYTASPCEIIVTGVGIVASAATLILAHGNKRKMSRTGLFMWHHGSCYVGDIDASKLLHEGKNTDKINKFWCQLMADRSKKTASWWYKQGDKDMYFTSNELLKMGVIDEEI